MHPKDYAFCAHFAKGNHLIAFYGHVSHFYAFYFLIYCLIKCALISSGDHALSAFILSLPMSYLKFRLFVAPSTLCVLTNIVLFKRIEILQIGA